MTEHVPDTAPDIGLLQAHLAEANGLITGLRDRCGQLRAQLAERDDAYTQLAALLEQQTGADEKQA